MAKRFIIILFILSLIVSCDKMNKKSNLKQENSDQEMIVDKWIYKIDKKSFGIDEELKKDMGVEKEIIKYSIIVLSKEDQSIIQEIKFENEKDLIVLIEKDSFIFDNLLKVKFKWDGFSTEPIGYTGYKYFLISKEDGKLKLIFSYFEKAGVQDEPFAELKEIKKNGNMLELNYQYYEAIGLPELGTGEIKVIYNIDLNSNKIIFNNLSCNIIRKARYINGCFDSADPTFRVNPPQNVYYSREELNRKFQYILEKYSLLY